MFTELMAEFSLLLNDNSGTTSERITRSFNEPNQELQVMAHPGHSALLSNQHTTHLKSSHKRAAGKT